MSVFGPQIDPNDYQAISDIISGYFRNNSQVKSVTTQFDKTNTTFANITGLSVNVQRGKTYYVHAGLFVNCDAVGGSKYTLSGTCTASSVKVQVSLVDNNTSTYTITNRQTSLDSSSSQAGTTAGFCEIEGIVTVSNQGTLTVQFAQSASNGTSSVLVGSYLIVKAIT